MVTASNPTRRSLKSWRPTSFLAAGIVLLGYSGLKSVELFTSVVLPDVVMVTIGHLGLLLPVFGLLGLYSQLRDVAPGLSLAGVVTSVTSGLCSMILLVALAHLTLTMEGYPAIPEDTGQGLLPPLWGAAILLASLLTILLGFLLFGVASLRTDTVPRTVSYLLLVPGIMWIALFVMHAAGIDGTVIGIVVYVPIATALLVIGHRLREEAVPTDTARPLSDPTA